MEFFEEEGDSGEEEKHGGHHEDREHKQVWTQPNYTSVELLFICLT